jgi:hypothetical protein
MNPRWPWRSPTQRIMNLGHEAPLADEYLRMLPAYLVERPQAQPAVQDLTAEPGSIPTEDLRVIVIPADELDLTVAPWRAGLRLRTRAAFGTAISDGVAGLLLGLPALGFALIIDQRRFQFVIFASWLVLVVYLRTRRRTATSRPGTETGRRSTSELAAGSTTTPEEGR